MTPAIAERLLSWPSPLLEGEARARIGACRGEVEAGRALHFVARTIGESAFVGWTSVWQTGEGDDWELGFWMAEPCQGQGLALEAAKAVIDHLRAAHRPRRLLALVQPGNVRSETVLTRLGLVRTGIAMRPAKFRGGDESFLVFERSFHDR